MELKNITKDTVFGVLGICGINGNLVARILKDKGYNVVGTDLSTKKNCKFQKALENYNIKIFYESHPDEFFTLSDYIFYPPGLSKEIPLFDKIQEKNIPIIEIEDIFKLLKSEKPVLGITGTNGKTTTTTLLKAIAYDYNLKPSEHNLLDMQGNSHYIPALQSLLNGDVAILEAGTFGDKGSIKLTTKLSKMDCGIITNITPDHLELGKDFLSYANIKGEMIKELNGKQLIVNSNDPTIMGLIRDYDFKGDLVTFGVDSETFNLSSKQCVCGNYLAIDEIISGSGYYNCKCGLKTTKPKYLAKNINLEDNSFILETPEGEFKINLLLEGIHNVFNVTGAIAGAREFLNIPYENIIESVSTFSGVPGRMESLGIIKNKKVIVDYAHNPGGVETVLREFKKIYGDFTLILTVSSESGAEGDLKILDIALKFAKYIIPSSKSSEEIAKSKIIENPELKEKIILGKLNESFNKDGTLGATAEDVEKSFNEGLKLEPQTIIAIGEAAIKFKSVFK